TLDHTQSPFPLSFAQERLWFLEQLEPGTSVYNIPWAASLIGNLDKAALQQALNMIPIRHEALRTTYEAIGGVPCQVIHEPVPISIEAVDLRGHPVEEREAKCQACLLEAANMLFDLTRGAMLRATLIQLADQEHVLLLVTHHIASDGWSQQIITRELSQVYNALVRADEPALPDPLTQYADFAHWQRQRLRGERLEKGLQYWIKKLQGLPPTLNLPVDHARGAIPEFGAAHVPVELTPALTMQLKCLALKEGATLFMVLLAGWMVLLGRYAQGEDIAIGTPSAGRLHPDTEQIIGFFVNTLVLRGDLSGDPTFCQLLRRVRHTCLEAYEQQEVPFEKLVAELHPERQRNQTPLFQVMFAFQNMPDAVLILDSIESHSISIDPETVKFDLRLELSERRGRISGTLDYRTQIFDRWRIGQLARHFVTLLQEIVARPDIAISQAPLLDEEEARRIVHMQTGPRLPVSPLCLHQAFEEQASRTTRAAAVQFGVFRLTYEELDDKANRLAHALRQRGVTSGDSVGLCVNPTMDSVVGILGILKAGAAYVPLDPTHPKERLSFMINDADVRVIVTHQQGGAMLSDQGRPLLDLDTDENLMRDNLRATLESANHPSDLAYVLYTSGSTGKPKGVAVEHRSVMNYVSSMREWLSLPTGASFSWIQPLSADTSVTTLLGALLSGGCVHVIPRECATDPDYLTNYGREHRIDVLKIAPTHLAALLQASTDPESLLPHRCLILGGEPTPGSLVKQIREFAPNIALFNHYGPTEATVGATVFPVDFQEGGQCEGMLPIGRPLHNVRTYVLDASMKLCPLGGSGRAVDRR
ncbi:condensation domain-containing protein, partial [Candidatus Bipolaricaulota bacterium]